jgi:hypothetical protein
MVNEELAWICPADLVKHILGLRIHIPFKEPKELIDDLIAW